ncbi:hypothetical protein B0H19DRAFT_27236 [Mycena capillaripes]|nr:hypothetical protein B0H19DRAFT_27236 [Mycena capillaripes]
MVIERIILALGFILSLTNFADALSLRYVVREAFGLDTYSFRQSSSLPRSRELTGQAKVLTKVFASSALFRSDATATPVPPFTESVTIGASIAIGVAALLLAVAFAVLWKRTSRKRQYTVDAYNVQLPLGRPQYRPVLRIGTDFPAEIKPVYLDSPRPRHSSIVAREQVLGPLAASQQPGFVPRPIPANIPISVPVSRAPSMRSTRSHFNPHYSLGVPPEDLAELLEDLSRHYVLADSSSPRPVPGHRHSASLTGRSRVYHDKV